MNRILRSACLVLLSSLLISCAQTERARRVEPSGFLADYSILKSTKGEVAQLVYLNQDVDWPRYTKVMIEPISIWRAPGSPLENAPDNEVRSLGEYFYQALSERLAEEYELVSAPSAGTLKIRAAITEAEKSTVALDGITTVVPVGLGVSAAKKLATGTHAFVGKAAGELEIRSATTDELLAAVVSRRVGGKKIGAGKLSSWGDVKAAADTWAASIADRLAAFKRGDTAIQFSE